MRKSNPTKYQLARMQTAFILDDVDYVKKNLKKIKAVESYDLYFYRKYGSSIWYYIFKNTSYNVIEYLLSLKCNVNIYANISINTDFIKLINIVNKLDETQYKLLYINDYESFIKYVVITLCNIKHFIRLIDISNVVDTKRFDINEYLQEIRYIYTHDVAASDFIRILKFKEIQNII